VPWGREHLGDKALFGYQFEDGRRSAALDGDVLARSQQPLQGGRP
jgi:hypothetical protein